VDAHHSKLAAAAISDAELEVAPALQLLVLPIPSDDTVAGDSASPTLPPYLGKPLAKYSAQPEFLSPTHCRDCLPCNDPWQMVDHMSIVQLVSPYPRGAAEKDPDGEWLLLVAIWKKLPTETLRTRWLRRNSRS
jgi:hypothetical protein